MRRIW